MKKNTKILPILLVILTVSLCIISGVMLFASNKALIPNLIIVLIVISMITAILSIISLLKNGSPSIEEPQPGQIKKPEKIVTPKVTAPKSSNDQAILLLTLLQEKGRIIDFIMEDVTAYSDQEVAGAARVIHQGCKEVIKDCFNPEAVCNNEENSKITLEDGYSVTDYKIVGNISGTPPYTGTLTHKGWKAGKINLPVLNKSFEGIEQPLIIPAEVEIK